MHEATKTFRPTSSKKHSSTIGILNKPATGSAMTSPIQELKDLSVECDSVTLPLITADGFRSVFGRLYRAVKRYNGERSSNETTKFVERASELLLLVVRHHQKNNLSIDADMAVAYEATVKLLLQMLHNDLEMDEYSYERAKNLHMKIKALKACGITLPGHFPDSPSRFDDKEVVEKEKTLALQYARENIEEFVSFVFNLGQPGSYVCDPFENGKPWHLFDRVKTLQDGLPDPTPIPRLS